MKAQSHLENSAAQAGQEQNGQPARKMASSGAGRNINGCSLNRDGTYAKKHGHTSGGKISSEYNSWKNMISRCTYPRDCHFHRYGAVGIKVCERWLESFENFLEDMGSKPTQKHTIDRKDGGGNYEKSNCRWATAKEQNANRRPFVHSNQFIKARQQQAIP